MNVLIHEDHPVARIKHNCDAYNWLMLYGDFTDFTRDELKAIAIAKRHGGKILPGEKYLKQKYKENGRIRTYKAIIALDDICKKYDLFDE